MAYHLTSILLREDTCETPGRVLKRLHVLDVHDQNITRLRGLYLKGSGQIMDFCKVNIADVVGRVVVLDLTTGPVDTLDLDCLAILNGTCGGDLVCISV